LLAACSDLKTYAAGDAGVDGVEPVTSDGGTAGADRGASGIVVEVLAANRDRPGARSPAGFRPWRTGIAVSGDRVYWVESGTMPGLYVAPTLPCPGTDCVEKVADAVRPASFTATSTHVYYADTAVIKRLSFGGGTPETVASASDEVVNLAATDSALFWSAGDHQELQRTLFGGTTSTIIRSNGTPVSFAIAGERLYWAGVDISGQTVALQTIGVDGKGAREVARFSGGFHTMAGNETYLYFAENNPGNIHRLTASTGREEVVAREALGVTDIAVDDRYAYWVEPGNGDFRNGRVRRIGHDAREAETLAESIPRPVAIAVSDDAVFVASSGTEEKEWKDGAILRLSVLK